jgi:hypothetical protein
VSLAVAVRPIFFFIPSGSASVSGVLPAFGAGTSPRPAPEVFGLLESRVRPAGRESSLPGHGSWTRERGGHRSCSRELAWLVRTATACFENSTHHRGLQFWCDTAFDPANAARNTYNLAGVAAIKRSHPHGVSTRCTRRYFCACTSICLHEPGSGQRTETEAGAAAYIRVPIGCECGSVRSLMARECMPVTAAGNERPASRGMSSFPVDGM